MRSSAWTVGEDARRAAAFAATEIVFLRGIEVGLGRQGSIRFGAGILPRSAPLPPHLAAAAYVMPMSCLVTRAIFPNISENAFAMRFSCLQDTFFTFFFLPGTEITGFTSASTTRTTRREPMLSFRSASRAGLRALLSTRTSPGAAGYGKHTIPFQHITSPSLLLQFFDPNPLALSS